MKLSIITVNLNNKDHLSKTINSIKKQTLKSNIDYEYILVDGGSTDGAIELIKSTNIISKYIIEKDKGIYDAMNKGIKLSTGNYLTFLNAGDYYLNENTLEKIFNQSNISNCDLIYGPVIVQRKNGRKISYPKKFNKFNLYFWGTRTVCHQAIFVKKNLVGQYSDKYKLKGELNWYLDLADKVKNYKIVNFPIVFYDPDGVGYKKWKSNIFEKIKVLFSRNFFYGFLCLPLTFLTIIRRIINSNKI